MKESEFIRQNKKRWNEFESELKGNSFNPERVANHYIKIIDDLSYSRTHYKNRLIRSYLNGVAQILSLRIYKSQKGTTKSFLKFWKTDLPLVMYHSQVEFLISFLVFALAALVGVFSGMNDPDFLRFIISDSYVDMTLENIAKGDPMAVYKDEGIASMFFGITINNILVSAYVFSLGMMLGIGTLLALVYNGVMLGAFQQFFFTHDVGVESMLTIWQHGTIEISAIILAGAAGLTLSKGMLFPGTYSRLDAFRLSGRKGLMMMLGLMPLLVYSGFIEAFITRLTDTHWSIRLAAILGSLFFVIAYFIWYPRRVARNKRLEDEIKIYLQPVAKTLYEPNSIQNNTTVAAHAWLQIQSNRHVIFALSAIVSLIFSAIFTWHSSAIHFGTNLHWMNYFLSQDLIGTQGNLWLFAVNFSVALFALSSSCFLLIRMNHPDKKLVNTIQPILKQSLVLLIGSFITALLLTDQSLIVVFIIWIPICALILQSQLDQRSTEVNRFTQLTRFLKFGWVRLSILSFMTLFFSTLVLYIFEETIVPKLYEAIYSFLPENHLPLEALTIFISTYVVISIAYTLFTFSFLACSLTYDSLREMASAVSLMEDISTLLKTEKVTSIDKKQILNRSKINAS